MIARINYNIGRLLNRFGYQLIRGYRVPQCTLNILELGIRLLNATKPNLTIVQIGAFDGELSDPLKASILKGANRAFLIEPQTAPYDALVRRYHALPNVTIVNSAITKEDGEVNMYLPKGENASPMASLHAEHLRNFAFRDSDVKSITVKSLTAASFLRIHQIEEIDVLQIDTEGFDYEILRQFLDLKIEPLIINLETLHLTREERNSLRQRLQQLNYQYVEYGIDLFALKANPMASFGG